MNGDESVSPLDLTIELARAEEAGDPFAFRFAEQTYLVRRKGGAVESAALLWDDELLGDLAALGRSDPVARQRVGERVRAFIAQADWDAREQEIAAALMDGRRVDITLRSSAAELYQLPWELLTLKATGQHLGELPGCLVRYEWPATQTAAPTPDPPPEGGRILFAWSAAGGAIAVAEHLEPLRRACAKGHHPFDPDRDVLAHASLTSLHHALAAPGPPVAVLHLLCHGSRLNAETEAYGLVWNASPPSERATALVDAGALRRVLGPHRRTLRLVVLSACYGGNAGAPGNALGAVAQELHRVGIPAVIASRQPLSVAGSITLTETLYRRLLIDLTSLEDAFRAARERLTLDTWSGDWASLQLYARAADGADHRPFVFRPYRGLATFGPADRRFFFGRDREIAGLVKALGTGRRLLTLLGASGSGKSSLVMAGLLPALVQDNQLGCAFRAAVLRPGAHPCEALAAAIASLGGEVAGDLLRHDLLKHPEALIQAAETQLRGQPGDAQLLLVVDQLEELFTQAEDRAEAAAFVAALLHAIALPAGRVHVVLTLRADFLGYCLDFDRTLAERVKASTVILLPMDEAELRQVILRPAALVGLRFDEGLVEALLDALREGSTASDLPLLAFALEALWERRRRNMIRWAAWEAIGGLKGAIAQRADEVLAGCHDDEARLLVRDLFSRLVQLGSGTEDTRRYAARAELESVSPDLVQRELDRWIRARLLTADDAHVWVAHEAVIRQWATLRRWIAEDREALLVQQEVRQASRQWEDSGRSADELWRGARLGRASELLDAGRLRLTVGEAAFVEAAQEAQRAEAEAAQARRRREITRSRRLAGASVFVAVLMGALGLLAWWQRGVANQAAREAQDGFLLAGARERLAVNQPEQAAALLLEMKDPGHPGWAQVALDTLSSASRSAQLRGHDGPVSSSAFSPDGRRTVTASDDRTARVWNVDGSDKDHPLILRGHEGPLSSARFSPDGRLIVTASTDGTARVWNADGSDKDHPLILRGHEGGLVAAFSPDGRRIVTASNDRTARVWNADGSDKDHPLILRGHEGRAISPAFSPDGRRIVTADDRTARVWSADGSDKDHPLVLRGHGARVLSAAFSPDGRRIVTASDDNTARVWDADGSDKDHPLILHGHKGWLMSAAFSPDGRRIVTASYDKTARVWNADGSDKNHPLVLWGHEGQVWSAVFSPDGRRVVTASTDNTARVWNIDGSNRNSIILIGHNNQVINAVFSPDGMRIVTVSSDKTARVWSANGSDKDQAAGLIGAGELTSAAFSPDATKIAATELDDGTARVWNADGSGIPVILRGHEASVLSVAFSPDGRRVATASSDKTARVWNADGSDKDRPLILRGHEKNVLAAVFSPDGRHVATVSDDKTARVWSADGSDGGRPLILRGHEGSIESARFSPDGRQIVTIATDETARVWSTDGSGNNHPIILRGHKGEMLSAAFSPDGRRIVTTAWDTAARVWNADGSDRDHPIILYGHEGPVWSAAFSPDGRRIVTVSDDKTVRVWNADGSDKEHPLVLRGHEGRVRSAAFSPDGRRIVTVSMDNTAGVWSVDGAGRDYPLFLRRRNSQVIAAVFSPDGTRIITVFDNMTVRVWSISIPVLQRSLRTESIECLPLELRRIYPDEFDAAGAGDEACERSSGPPSSTPPSSHPD
ncbi:nSTAND1 domain-containing NTPase [Sorangium sp. So ce1389]|uniref:nSTAND1 domain-containing NTPase n=1 Tax=Sorangium sp. So ce1389 TaxID=3133336 RepID=UPI003F607411